MPVCLRSFAGNSRHFAHPLQALQFRPPSLSHTKKGSNTIDVVVLVGTYLDVLFGAAHVQLPIQSNRRGINGQHIGQFDDLRREGDIKSVCVCALRFRAIHVSPAGAGAKGDALRPASAYLHCISVRLAQQRTLQPAKKTQYFLCARIFFALPRRVFLLPFGNWFLLFRCRPSALRALHTNITPISVWPAISRNNIIHQFTVRVRRRRRTVER